MRIAALTAYHACIPLKRPIRHASHSRSSNDALIVRCTLDDGTMGWGEGLPRDYVTGETIDSAWRSFEEADFRASLGEPFDGFPSLIALLEGFEAPLPPSDQRDCFGNAYRCAVELAVLDAACRRMQCPLSEVTRHVQATAPFRANHDRVRYSAAISSTAIPKAMTAAAVYRYYEFAFCKLKIGTRQLGDGLLARAVRMAAGRAMDLRVDANEAWSPQNLESRVAQLVPSRISAVEQPLAHADVGALRVLKPRLGVSIVLDESLCSRSDAVRAIEERLCDIFNIRLSKCGGYLRSLDLAAAAHAAGLGLQLGCQVGETGILSAAGRHWACSVNGLQYLEGSFDRILVAEPLIREDITFRRGGWGRRLEGSGLGVTVDEQAIERLSIRKSVKRVDSLS